MLPIGEGLAQNIDDQKPPIAARDGHPRIVHQHTHVHHHLHRSRHVHHRKVYVSHDVLQPYGQARTKVRKVAPPVPRKPAHLLTAKQRLGRLVRRFVMPTLLWLGDAIVFILTRISFGFGFRVAHLPFFGDNRD